MNKIVFWLVSIIFFISIGCKTTKKSVGADITSYTESSANNIGESIYQNSLLWKIVSPNTKSISYLFGTIHIIASNDFFYPTGTISALEHCDEVIFEIDINELKNMEKQLEMISKFTMPQGTSLKTLLNSSDYDIVFNRLKEVGMPIQLVENLKPAFLNIFAMEDFDPEDLETGKIKSYEFEFERLTSSLKKKSSGLETIEFQLEIFDKIPLKVQATMLVEAIKDMKNENGTMDRMIKAYKEQNINLLHKMLIEDEFTIKYYKDLITYRNEAWINALLPKLHRQSNFIAVGAGHIGGPDGLIALLRKNKFEITPVLIK